MLALPDQPKRISTSSFGLPPARRPARRNIATADAAQLAALLASSAGLFSNSLPVDCFKTSCQKPRAGRRWSVRLDIAIGVLYGKCSLRDQVPAPQLDPVDAGSPRAASSTSRSMSRKRFGRPAPR